MPVFKKIIVCFLLLISGCAWGQGRLFVHNFLPTDYPGQTQNWAIETDTNNVVWIANQHGLMSFNGNQWGLISTPQQSTVRSIDFAGDGTLYVGALSDLGYISNDSSKTPHFVSLVPKIEKDIHFSDVWSTVAFGDTVLYLTDNYLLTFQGDSLKVLPRTFKFFYLAFKVNNHCLVQQIGGGLFRYRKGRLLKLQNSDFFKQRKIHAIFKSGEQYMLATKHNGLYTIRFNSAFTRIEKIEPFRTDVDHAIKKYTIYQARNIGKNQIGLATTHDGLYIINKKGALVHHFSIENQLLTDAVYDFTCTDNGALWLAQDMGLNLIEIGMPVVHYNHKTGIKGTVSEIARFNNKVYVNTGFGTYWLEPDAPFHQRKFHKIDNLNLQAWGMLTTGGERTEKDIYSATARGIYKIDNQKAVKVYESTDVYTLYAYAKNPEYIFAGTHNGLLLLRKMPGKWETVYQFKEIKQQVRDIAEDRNGNIWFALNYRGFFKIADTAIDQLIANGKAPEYRLKDTTNGLTSLRDIQFQHTGDQLLFAALPELYVYDESSDLFQPVNTSSSGYDTAQNKPTTIPEFSRIENNTIYIAQKNRVITDSTTLRRLPYNITTATWMDSTEIWLGTENGLYHYKLNKRRQTFSNFTILLNKIRIGKNDWKYVQQKQKNIFKELDYKHNSISVSVSIPFYYNYLQNKISFYLEGFDEQHEAWHQQFKKTYTNLPPGEYTLYAKAKNIFGNVTRRPLIKIQVNPPLYLTTFAYIFYITAWIVLMVLAIRYRTQKLRKSRDKLENVVQERTKQLIDRNEEVMRVAEILRKNNKKLKELSIVAEKAGNAVAIFDKAGKLDYCNNAFEELYGYTCEEFRKERGNFLFENSEYPHIRKAHQQCIEEKGSVQYEYFTLSKNHEGLWIHTTLTPVFNNKGEPEQYIAIDTNITQLKNAEEEVRFQKEELERKSKELAQKNQELQRLSIIVRETDNAVILTDKTGSLLWANEGFTRLYGFTLDELRRQRENVFTMSSNKKIKEYIKNWPEDQSSITYESQNPTREGHKIWAQTTLTPIRDEEGNIDQIIAIDTDITALKKAEEQIEQQRDQLKTLNATKDKFFSIIGHDLRSPFGNFVNMTNIIMQNITTSDTQTLLNYVSKLQRSAQNSYNLLENLLDWARHQQGRIKYYPDFDDITAVVEEMTELLLPLAERKKIDLKLIYDEPIYAYFDEHMIKTVVRNLMFNALKYTPTGGEIKFYFEKNKEMIKIFIEDNGIGISQEAQTKIFRTDTHFTTLGTDKERGTGLGLILSKDFVEMNGGTIAVKSQPKKGSTFIVSLPRKAKDHIN